MVVCGTRKPLTMTWLVAAVFTLGIGAAGAMGAPDEFRAIACSRFEWPNKDLNTCKAYIDTLMQRLRDNNFNAVILQMRGQADTLYPSPYEPWSYILSSDGYAPTGWGDFDPMAYAINKAHENGLEFHAYLNAHVCWNSSSNPPYGSTTDRRHLFWEHCNVNDSAHRDWLCCDSSGTPRGYDGEYVWIAPGIPDFQAYWRKQIMYVVEYYDGSDPVTRPRVDGVHFDRIRTNSTDWSHDPISEARRLGEANPAGLSFGDWTRDQITRTLCDLYAQINEHHPYVRVSSAPLGMHSSSRYTEYGYPVGDCAYGGYGYSCKYQDPQGWLAAGAQDFICPQIYWADLPWRTSDPHFSEILPDWLVHNSGRHVYPFVNVSATGPGLLSESSVMRAMVGQTGQGNAPGLVIWYYGGFFGLVPPTYATDLGPLFSNAGGPYEEPANTPAMPWKDNPTDGIIIGNVTDGANPIVDAKVTRSGSTYTALSSADGLYSFLLVPPGTYELTFVKPGVASKIVSGVTVTAGQVTRVDVELTGTDTVAPVISQVAAANLLNTQATITWLTDEFSDSRVAFGTAPGNRPLEVGDDSLVAVHSITLMNLQPATTYYFAVTSGDKFNNTASWSDEYQFTTLGGISDFIVESRSGGQNWSAYKENYSSFSNSTAKSTAPGLSPDALGSRYTTSQTGQTTYSFTPSVSAGYEVFATWGTSSSGSPQVKHVISHANGTTEITVNQNSSAGLQNQWVSLGTYPLYAGTVYTVKQQNLVYGQRLMADAVKWVSAAPLADAGSNLTVFGTSAGVQVGGNPTASGGATPYKSYLWTVTPTAGASFDQTGAANPTLTVTAAGTYQVCVTVTDAADRQGSDCATITVNSTRDLGSFPTGVTQVTGNAFSQLGGGNTSAAFGDLNGDGYADAILGAQAAVFVVYGSSQIAAQSAISCSSPPSGVKVTTVTGSDSTFGAAVASADVNGDGYDDAIIGAHQDVNGSTNPGQVYIVYGRTDMSSLPTVWVDVPMGVYVTKILGNKWTPRVALGWSLATGDVNADGFADVIIGSPMATSGSRANCGLTYVLYGSAAMPPADAMASPNTIDLTNAPGTYGETRLIGATSYDQLGSALACADVNGDGYDDLVVGAQNASPSGKANAGAAYVLYGSPTAGQVATIDLYGSPGSKGEARIFGADPGDRCGRAMAADDVNGDGYVDILIGAPFADPTAGNEAGEMCVIYGAGDFGTKTVDLGSAPPAGIKLTRFYGEYFGDRFGNALGAGDVNGDGFADVLIGAYLADPPATAPHRIDAGAAYFEYGKTGLENVAAVNLQTVTSGAYFYGALDGNRLGTAIGGGGDMNLDGVGDTLVTAPLAGGGAGFAYVNYGSLGSTQAQVRRYDRAGNAPKRDFGPAARCMIDFQGDAGTASETVVTLIRDKERASIAPKPQVANVMWQIDTNRAGDWTADVTFRYSPTEVTGLTPSGLVICRADSLTGTFTPLPTTVDTTRNTLTVTIPKAAGSVFALKIARPWAVTPASSQATMLAGAASLPNAIQFQATSNASAAAVNFVVTKDQDWITLDKAAVTLSSTVSSDAVTARFNNRVRALAPGQYTCTLTFQDLADPAAVELRPITLTVTPCSATVVERGPLAASGPAWTGPYSPTEFVFDVTNTGEASLDCSTQLDANWLTANPGSTGTLAPGGSYPIRVYFNSNAQTLPAGTHTCNVTFTTACATIVKQIVLTVTCPSPPTAISITPPSDEVGRTCNVAITGTGFVVGKTGARLVMNGQPDIVATNVTVTDANNLTCTFNLATAVPGERDLIVTTCADSPNLAQAFEAICTLPGITSITPAWGEVGGPSNVAIAGSNFVAGKTSVKLTQAGQTDIAATNVAVTDANNLTCTFNLTTAPAGKWNVIVTTCGDATLTDGFEVGCTLPTVTSVDPPTGEVDQTCNATIVGAGFVAGKTNLKLVMAGETDIVATNVVVTDANNLTCRFNLTGAPLGKRDLVITTCAETVTPDGFEVTCTPPTMLYIDPPGALGVSGQNVTIVGTGFVAGKTTVKLTKAGQADIVATNVSVTSTSRLSCTFNLSQAALGHWDAVVSTCADGLVSTNAFYVMCDMPSLQSIAVTSGFQGQAFTNVLVVGNKFVAGHTAVWLSRTGQPDIMATNVTVNSPLTLTCDLTIPVAAVQGTWNVNIGTCASASIVNGFTVGQAPCVAPTANFIAPNLLPNDSPVTTIAIRGSNFLAGQTTVKLRRSGQSDIVATNVQVLDSAHLRCEIDVKNRVVGKWDLIVTTCTSATMSAAFDIVTPCDASHCPVILLAAPLSATQGDVLTGLTIPGGNFIPDGTVVKLTKAGQPDIPATNVNVAPDGNSLTADITLVGAAVGHWDLVVATCGPTTAANQLIVRQACNTPPQDVDNDNDVDVADFLTFQTCFNGPNRLWGDPPALPPACGCMDADWDADIDGADFVVFQRCFNGPNRPSKCQ